ncbi:MAG: CoA transferase [Deltaproteobacteria bacterium]|nr:CoA transferase [Deltaproteobacteria bacterium]
MSALDAIRVIDFGQYIAGPLTGMLLADQGARVIRVDPPGGPVLDSSANACWNRGKQSIALDLKRADQAEIARRLALDADVLIENFRPGVMQRLGLGADALRALNPRLIYCSLPGFAADDPRSGMPGWEGVVAAACALFADQGEGASPFGPDLLGKPVTAEPGSDVPPAYTPIPVASCNAAFFAATAIGVSLSARERDGHGERIEVSLFDAMYGVFSLFGLKVHGVGAHPFYLTPWSRPYRCSDDRWLMLDINYSRDLDRFLDGMGLEAWRERGFGDRSRVQRDSEVARAVLGELECMLAQRTAEEWQERFSGLGLCASVCNTNEEWLRHPHALASHTLLDVDDPVHGRMRQPGIQVSMSQTPGRVRSPAPLLDADRDEVLRSLDGETTAVEESKPLLESALAGIKVLDLCIILAGPTCGRTLAEFGADVIKIDDPNREGGDSYQLDVNRAKRSILLDLASEAGLKTFWGLAEQADVIVEGFRQGVVERLGIGYEDVRRRVPDIVYASINCYGESGPWSGRPGYEQLAQAATGMQERYGDGIPRLQSMPINDYGTGFSAAFAIALALYHRQRTGRGQHVFTSLTRTATTLQSLYLHDYAGRSWSGIPRGPLARGECARQRLYRARDGWFFLGASAAGLERLLRLPAFAGLSELADAALQDALGERFLSHPVRHWSELAREIDIGLHALQSVDEAMNDPVALSHGVSITREHPGIGLVRTNGPSRRQCHNRPTVPGRPAPIQGSDGEDIARNLWGSATGRH